mmetsp:Transcript_8267/g.28388  ORF Transcript_8267/g.28388 Transcript_8267/m.28388 type:complete len:314 (+) Transcript_8267:579-1520(+)
MLIRILARAWEARSLHLSPPPPSPTASSLRRRDMTPSAPCWTIRGLRACSDAQWKRATATCCLVVGLPALRRWGRQATPSALTKATFLAEHTRGSSVSSLSSSSRPPFNTCLAIFLASWSSPSVSSVSSGTASISFLVHSTKAKILERPKDREALDRAARHSLLTTPASRISPATWSFTVLSSTMNTRTSTRLVAISTKESSSSLWWLSPFPSPSPVLSSWHAPLSRARASSAIPSSSAWFPSFLAIFARISSEFALAWAPPSLESLFSRSWMAGSWNLAWPALFDARWDSTLDRIPSSAGSRHSCATWTSWE